VHAIYRDNVVIHTIVHCVAQSFGINGIYMTGLQGVRGMHVGGLRRLLVPPELAYGDTQVGGECHSRTLVYLLWNICDWEHFKLV